MANSTFISKTFMMRLGFAFCDIRIGNISSLVDKYIDISVPNDIILVIYKLVAITEKPH